MATNNRKNDASKNEINFTRADVYRGATSGYRKKKPGTSMMALILCGVLFVSVVAASVVHIATMERPEKTKQQSIAEQFVEENATPPLTPLDFFDEVTVSREQVHEGDLILVNYDNEYVFPETEDHLVSVYTAKSENYQVAYNSYLLDTEIIEIFNDLTAELKELTGDSSLLVNSAYRTEEDQQEIYDDYLALYGQEYVDKYVAMPGNSEHHTGMCMDLTVRKPDGTYVVLENYEYLSEFVTLATRYGFIQRYTAAKTGITRTAEEPWHYRYVGIPHAYTIRKQNFCLEEYIEYLKDYTSDGEIIALDSTGEITTCDMTDFPENSYVFYYVPAEKKGDTNVPVPKNATEYSISGNNVDGFIVTAIFGEVTLPDVKVGVVVQ